MKGLTQMAVGSVSCSVSSLSSMWISLSRSAAMYADAACERRAGPLPPLLLLPDKPVHKGQCHITFIQVSDTERRCRPSTTSIARTEAIFRWCFLRHTRYIVIRAMVPAAPAQAAMMIARLFPGLETVETQWWAMNRKQLQSGAVEHVRTFTKAIGQRSR